MRYKSFYEYTRDRYLRNLKLNFIVIPSVCLIVFIVLVAWSIVVYHATGAVVGPGDAKFDFIVMSISFFICSLIQGIINLICGPFSYKRFAYGVIANQYNLKAERIYLDENHLLVTHQYCNGPQDYEIDYAGYGIKVEKDKNYKKPTFIVKGKRVKKLILPDEIFPKPFYWGYKVIDGSSEKMLCVQRNGSPS